MGSTKQKPIRKRPDVMSEEKKTEIPGKLKNGVCTGRIHEPGSRVNYQIYQPEGLKENCPEGKALYVMLEHNASVMGPMLGQFMKEGLIPWGYVLFCESGVLPPSLPGGTRRGMRAEELDQYGPGFTDFLIEELIPEALRSVNGKLDPSPDMHFITGGSSGGMAAWNAVWFRNDFFRRAFLSSPTFSAMRGGEEPMVLVRKTEPRPIRLYLTSGTEEPDYFFGSSLYAALNAASALEFAGYDFRFELFRGEGHCCRREDPTLWRRIVTFLWANWRDVPVRPLAPQIRIRNLVRQGTGWESWTGPFPEKRCAETENGVYTFQGGTVYLEKDGVRRKAADGFGEITALAVSTDRWRLILADRTRRFLYAMSIQEDGSLNQLYPLAPLHLAHDCRIIGARDVDILEDDRVLAATELGIQGVVSFGLTDLILPLPGDLPADRVAVKDSMLYAASGERIFRRPLRKREAGGEAVPPSSPGYSDGFWYARSHLILP